MNINEWLAHNKFIFDDVHPDKAHHKKNLISKPGTAYQHVACAICN